MVADRSSRLLALVLLVSITIAGCVNVFENQAERRIQAYLEHKYDGTFQVGEVTHIAPSPDEPFGVGYYTGTALHVETGVSFQVICQVVGTGDVCDHYTKALYGQQAEREIRRSLAQHPAFGVEELELSWYASPDDWDPSVPFEEMADLFSMDVTLTVQEEGLVDQAEALLALCQTMEALDSVRCFDIILHVDGVQAKAMIPDDHRLDVELIRSDLEKIAQYAQEEHKVDHVLRTFQEEHDHLGAYSLTNEYHSVYSEDAYFGVELDISEEHPTMIAEDVFKLCQALRSEDLDFSLTISTSNGQNVILREEDTEDLACIERSLRELE